MDLAESIRENTRAVQALTAALMAHNFSTPVVINASELPAPPAAEPEPAPAKPARVKKEKPEAAPAPAPEPVKALDYDVDIKPAATKLAAKDRDALVGILTSFGVKRGTELKPEQFAEFLGTVKRTLGE